MGDVVKKASDFFMDTGNVVWAFSIEVVGSIFGLKKPSQPGGMELTDRATTITSAEAPHTYIYGRARVGSAIVAVFASGAKDEFKHVVCIHAAHECDAIEEVYINGVALGALDGSGGATSGIYSNPYNSDASESFSGTGITLAHTPNAGTCRLMYYEYYASAEQSGYAWFEELSYTLTGNVISGAPARTYTCNYNYSAITQYVKVQKHLGAAGQAADAMLMAAAPSKWTASCTLSGLCYTVITLNLNYADFQHGCPSIEVLVRGKKLHDVRSASYPNDVPVWSQNPALMIADYLTSEMCGVLWTDLPLADFIAAANVCDENITLPVNIGARYLANGTVTAEQGQREVLEKMAACMAGTIAATTWGITAGKYVAPVMALTQADIVGDMSYNAGTAESDLFSGIKGQFISPTNFYVATDFAPYQNAAYVTADGQELWSDIDFMFTDTKQRVHNLARIYTEDQRNAFTIKAGFSYKCWTLQVGQRISLTSSFLGQTAKVYRIINKSYAADAPVTLTLKEDAASIWDFEDAVVEDATPNTNLPSPFVVAQPGNVQVSELLYETTNSSGVKVKAVVTWTAPADVNVLDYTIEYKKYEDAYYLVALYSVSTQIEIFDISAGRYDFKVTARNHLNIKSAPSAIKTATIYGLTALPGDVLGFSVKAFNGSALCQWDRTIDLDVKIGGDIEIRFCPLTTGASWEQSVIMPDGKYNGDATSAVVSLGTGTYYAKFKDSSWNYSLNAASFVATESLVTGWTTVATSTQHTGYAGVKTNCAAADGFLKISGISLIDSLGLLDSLGYIDSLGGISNSATYEFDAVMDLATVASRRFHAHIQSLSYSVIDLFDSKAGNFDDAMGMFDGGTINSTSATVWASISNDNVTYSAWTPFMVADFTCRYAKFKLLFATNDPANNIQISELSVAAKVTP